MVGMHTSTMNMKVTRKLGVSCMAALTLWIIGASFWVLVFQVVVTWRFGQNRGHYSYNSSLANMTRSASTVEQHISTSLGSVVLSKIKEIKMYLNDPTLSNEALLPVNRIGRYILLNANLCRSVPRLDFIIVVHTALPNFKQRLRIRASFANSSLFYPIQIRVVFLLGRTNWTDLTSKLWLEHHKFKDTVMGDFIDDYHNLSIKGVMGYRWLKDYCPNADFVLKIDDDVLINMFRLIHWFLPQMKEKKRSIFCNCNYKNTMLIERAGKWKVDSHIFPRRRTFPYHYCSGFTVIMTSDLIDSLYKAAKLTPYFWIDDFYLYGMLPFVAGNVTYHYLGLNRNMSLKYSSALYCTVARGVWCPVFSTLISDDKYWYYWQLIKDLYITPNVTKLLTLS
ncbi:hypothetical protein BsWGS_01069 [Bradybaena similaris]